MIIPSDNKVLTFGLTSRQLAEFHNWKDSLPEFKANADAGAYTFKFTYFHGTVSIVVERIDGYSITLKEDYYNW